MAQAHLNKDVGVVFGIESDAACPLFEFLDVQH
jgi:hypothetical protein